jgi:ATP-dependent RNA helicase SUPV3L1/SUV3
VSIAPPSFSGFAPGGLLTPSWQSVKRPGLPGRNITAMLGSTNTGKTHYALERMLGHGSGMIGLPLRLLAREVYQRLVARVGVEAVALITGEEKIKPKRPRYWVSTVEAMPRDIEVGFVAIDEVQLIADQDRGHVFTDAVLNRRGQDETLLIGASTARPLIEALVPGVQVVTRPRLSQLTFDGEKKITRLPPRSAIIAFSAEEVYAIAELVRRQRGGAGVVMGSLSPRTRNAQVDMFQAGEVDHIIATDAIGMGLNLEINHVAFASDRKFDGKRHRHLFPAEMAQIAGRAGRATQDGTFGSTGRCPPFDEQMIDALENHVFDPISHAEWRNSALDFASLTRLEASLNRPPPHPQLVRARKAEDEVTLEIAMSRPAVRALATSPATVRRLWEMCQLPDYRKASPNLHADLVLSLYESVIQKGTIDVDWFAREVQSCDRVEGDIDALSWRLSQIRTWSYCANREDWLRDPEHWQNATRKIEDKLSDMLHERLMQRFVDRRTSVLMRRLKENVMLDAQVTATGDVVVEGQHIGRLEGFRFTADPNAEGAEAKALRAAAANALTGEIETRATRLSTAGDEQITLSLDGIIRFIGEPIAVLQAGARIIEPRFVLLADESLAGLHKEMAETRLALWLKAHIQKLLGPLLVLEAGEGLTGIARGIAFQIAEGLGVIDRALVANDVRALEQDARAALRKLGVRFGAHHLFLPVLMKPGPRSLAAQLSVLAKGGELSTLRDVSHLAFSGRTSLPVDPAIEPALYRVAGFKVAGARAIRVDILERLADLIRPAIAYRPGTTIGEPPPGTADGDGFIVTGAMTSLVGCAGADFAEILKSLGYRVETRPGPAITKPILRPAPMVAIAQQNVADAPAADQPVADAPSEVAETPEPVATAEASIAEAEPVPHVEDVMPPAQDEPAEAELVQDATVVQDAILAQDIPAEMPEADAGVVEVPPVEVQMVEIWRVARAERQHHRPHHRQPAGEGETPRPPRRDWSKNRNNNAAARPAGAANPAGGDASSPELPGTNAAPSPRLDRREKFEKFGAGKPHDRPRSAPGGEKPGEARQDGAGRRPDNRGNDQRRDGKPGGFKGGKPSFDRSFLDQKPKGEKQPDPDSPFAKLLALKNKLEGKD